MSISIPPEIQSKFIVVTTGTAVESRAEELQSLLSTLRQYVHSEEPNTSTYRTARGVGTESNVFTIIEEYTDRYAFEVHINSEPFKVLLASGTIATMSIAFSEEFF
ncbi:hypothetical protein L218DRAFT_1000217 [Marasmius fiardii PR-910]|nr:hypothetical protein L218DRAFT_1000217 [Marasmius fiardii PR-910]